MTDLLRQETDAVGGAIGDAASRRRSFNQDLCDLSRASTQGDHAGKGGSRRQGPEVGMSSGCCGGREGAARPESGGGAGGAAASRVGSGWAWSRACGPRLGVCIRRHEASFRQGDSWIYSTF